jgi:NAD(P)-dependent dehydrogenase (short-subunit alcohol dehydrogenase family)
VSAPRLAGKTAIVTGGAKGQGAAAVRLFAREGARVLLADLLDDEGEKTAKDVRAEGGEALYRHCDVSREDDVRAMVAAAVESFGGVDVLYNNAGIVRYGRPIVTLEVEDWDRVLAVNLRGTFLCAKHAAPHMMTRGGGSIVNVSSHGAYQASQVGIADYGASKGGIITLTLYMAAEFGAHGIRANVICPGPIRTDFNAVFLDDPAMMEMTRQMIPLHRVGDVMDVARMALFLASDEAKFVTGGIFKVDGGITIL